MYVANTKETALSSPKGNGILLESGTNELEILVFTLNEQRYGVNVAKVREVIEPLNITSLPHSHDAAVGVFQLRDEITPLIDLKLCLGKPPADQSIAKIVIMEFNDNRVGFLVDTVEQIYRVSWEAVTSLPDLDGVNESSVTSIAHIQEQMVLMLDFEKIVFDIGGVDLFEESARRISAGTSRGDHHILLAEDSKVMRTLIHGNLETAGYTNVTVCNDGQAAWDELQKDVTTNGSTTFDLIITDIEMPRMDGLHVTSRIRADAALKHLPVVIFSSLVSVDNEKKCESVGADAQITKPQLDKLVDLLDKLIAEGRTASNAEANQPAVAGA